VIGGCEYSSWLLADAPLTEPGAGACGDLVVARIPITPVDSVSTINLPVCEFHLGIVRASPWVAESFHVGKRRRIVRE
jgi:hypothetical protein